MVVFRQSFAASTGSASLLLRAWTLLAIALLALLAARPALAAPVDVTTLGVVPNDGLNDSATITAALAAHADLYFPPGEYRLNTTVYIPSGRDLHGAGKTATIFKLGTNTVAFRVDGQSDIFLDNFGIDRPFDNSVDEAIFVYNSSSRVQLNQLRVTNQRSRAPALSFHQSSDCAVRHCDTIDNMRFIFEDNQDQVYGSGITFHTCTNVVVEYNNVYETRDMNMPTNPYFNYFQAGSIQVSGCTNALVQYNRITYAGQAIDMGGTNGALVRGNIIENCHSVGIKLVNGSANQKILGNWVKDAGLVGIWIAPGNTDLPVVDCVVDGNTLIGVGKGFSNGWWTGYMTGTAPAGVHVDNANSSAGRCHDDTITNNTFHDNDQMAESVIVRPSAYQGYNITIGGNQVLGTAAPAAHTLPAPPPVAVPLSLTNAVVDPSDPLSNLSDERGLTRAVFSQGSAAANSRWSFTLDLESTRTVRSIALYGEYTYRADEAAPGGLVQVEAATTLQGPYTLVGARDFGGDRATNPFTGGKGKRIQLTGAFGRYLRISGGPWQDGFENNVILSEVRIDPLVVLDDYSPVHNPNIALPNPASHPQQSVWNVGGGFENERTSLDIIDGKLNTGVIALLAPSLTLDVAPYAGQTPVVDEFVIDAFDTDISLLPKTGTVRASSSDEPGNMDLLLNSFDVGVQGNRVIIPSGSGTPHRYYRLDFATVQNGAPASGNLRLAEVGYTGQVPVELSSFSLE